MDRIVIFHTDEDTLERIANALLQAGLETTARLVTTATTARELADFIRTHDPDVVVYDVCPPIEDSIARWQALCADPRIGDVGFVLTTQWAHVPVPQHRRVFVAERRAGIRFEDLVTAVQHARDGRALGPPAASDAVRAPMPGHPANDEHPGRA